MIILIISILIVIILCAGYIIKFLLRKAKQIKLQQHKDNRTAFLLSHWIFIKQRNGNLSKYFQEHNYQNIAIKGINEICYRLIDELIDSDINIVCIIGNKKQFSYPNIDVISLEESKKYEIDIVVDCDILAEPKVKINNPIINVEDIVFDYMDGGLYGLPSYEWRKK